MIYFAIFLLDFFIKYVVLPTDFVKSIDCIVIEILNKLGK